MGALHTKPTLFVVGIVMPTYNYLPPQKSPIGLFADLAQIPSLEGEGAEGGWGDIESMSNKSHFWSSLK